jgi:hypothetical protein
MPLSAGQVWPVLAGDFPQKQRQKVCSRRIVIFRPVQLSISPLKSLFLLVNSHVVCKRGQFVSAYGTMAVLLTKAAVSTILQKHPGNDLDVCNLAARPAGIIIIWVFPSMGDPQ